MRPIIAIDPGQSGGFAWRDADGDVHAVRMPVGMAEQVSAIRALADELPGVGACVERVGTYRPGNSATAACTFARHCGHIEAALYMCGVSCEYVAPAVWQRALGALPKEKLARKRAIKEAVARMYPCVTVTLYVADALGILTWALKRRANAL